METRVELWKGYRENILKNIELEKAVHFSNKKLNTLFNRLEKVDSSYNKSYFDSTKKTNMKLKQVSDIELTPSKEVMTIIDIINDKEQSYSYSLEHIDKLSFSSKELDETIKVLKEGKYSKMRYVADDTLDNISIKTKVVDLRRNNVKLNIAIDGPSGSGKSSAAKEVAKNYKMKYINTGLVYRAIALNAINNNIDLTDTEAVIASLESSMMELHPDEQIFLKGKDVTNEVRRDDVSQAASKVAAISEVRIFALQIMQATAKYKGVIMDGRDTTFRVLPNAELKFYIDTKAEVRATRRVEQNKTLGLDTDYDSVLKEIKERDHRDENREIDPLHIVEDAIVIDSSEMTLKDVVNKISDHISDYWERTHHE